MRAKVIAAVLVAVLGLTSVADASHTRKGGKGLTGKITGVGKNSLTLSVSSSNGVSKVYTVKYSAATTIAGRAHHSINASVVGESATVVGKEFGKAFKATEIVIAG